LNVERWAFSLDFERVVDIDSRKSNMAENAVNVPDGFVVQWILCGIAK
jgi:hypothetical protein